MAESEAVPAETKGKIQRGAPEVSPSISQFVSAELQKIKSAEKYWDGAFQRMRDNIRFARGLQWDDDASNKDKYILNIVQRHIKQRTSALYARNPKFEVHRRERLNFEFWDEKPESVQMLTEQLQADPENLQLREMAMNLQEDIKQATIERQMADRVARTLEILMTYQIGQQEPNFKRQAKRWIRRVETTGIGWLRVGFQRAMKLKPDAELQAADIASRLSAIERLAEDQMVGLTSEETEEAEKLRSAMEVLQSQEQVIVREGLTVSFPLSTRIILDTATQSIDGFIGTGWLAEKFLLTKDKIKEIYKIDITGCATEYSKGSDTTGEGRNTGSVHTRGGKGDKNKKPLYCVYLVYNRELGTMYTLCDGYSGYLAAPSAPDVDVEPFYPYLCLMFNDLENGEEGDNGQDIFPLSDVDLMRSPQKEYNRSKEALRQHRIAMKPLYATAAGAFDEEDQTNLSTHEAHDVLILNGLAPNENVNSKLQMVQKWPIDPNVYATEGTMEDVSRAVGTQEANLGTLSGATATETSLAEDTRLSGLSSNADDLDDCLTEFARQSGQILFMNMSVEQVKKIVGPGAMWPEFSRQEIMDEISLTIEAGSSGRPNKAAKAAAIERVANVVLSIPGVNPRWLFKQIMMSVDDTMDLTEAYQEGEPSILQLNQLASLAETHPTGGANDPTLQGGKGGMNQRAVGGESKLSPMMARPGPQAGMTAPT